MLSIASDISHLLHAQDKLETLAIKTASADISLDAQTANRDAADGIYRAITKEAGYRADGQNPFRFCLTIKKMASALNKEQPTPDTQLKMAAAVVVDEALCNSIQTMTDPKDQLKIAEQIAYGREYLSELLRGVL
jgi:hypothetical protein